MNYCWNESDHRRQAQRDFERGRKDRDNYDRHTWDACKEVYTQEYDRLAREDERRQEERREEERIAERHEQQRIERQREEQRQQEEAEYYAQLEAQEAAENAERPA